MPHRHIPKQFVESVDPLPSGGHAAYTTDDYDREEDQLDTPRMAPPPSFRFVDDPEALRASNLSDEALQDGIQPGEALKVKGVTYSLDGTQEGVNYYAVNQTAPDETGTFRREVTIGGETVEVAGRVVEPTEPRDVETNPKEEIDVSSAPGMQGAETVESGVSDLAEQTGATADTVAGVTMTPDGPRETDGLLGGVSAGGLAVIAGLVALAVAVFGGNN